MSLFSTIIGLLVIIIITQCLRLPNCYINNYKHIVLDLITAVDILISLVILTYGYNSCLRLPKYYNYMESSLSMLIISVLTAVSIITMCSILNIWPDKIWHCNLIMAWSYKLHLSNRIQK